MLLSEYKKEILTNENNLARLNRKVKDKVMRSLKRLHSAGIEVPCFGKNSDKIFVDAYFHEDKICIVVSNPDNTQYSHNYYPISLIETPTEKEINQYIKSLNKNTD